MANPKGLALSYRHLHQNLDAAFKRSQDGLRACKATLLFLQQSAALEETFGNSMVKVGEGFAGIHEQNGPSLNKAVASICSAIQGLGRQHCSLATSINQDVCRSIATFTEQQAEQVRRMISETQALSDDMAKERALHRKVRDKYRRACRDAEVIIKQAALKGGRSEAMQLPPGSDRPSPTDNGAGGLQKIDALWSKVWDQLNASASAGIRSLRERATEAMDTLREAEAEYDTSRRQLEEKEAEYRRAIEDRLTHFEANEESRALLVKTQLQRLHSCRGAALERIDRNVLRMLREAAEQVDVSADYAVYLSHMAKPPPADASVTDGRSGLDASMDKFTQPSLAHIDRCVKNLRALCHCFSELAAAEETYARGLAKLADKAGYPDTSPDAGKQPLRRASPVPLRVGPARSTFRKFMESEGQSMREAWEGYMRGNHAISRLHLSMSSRVAESVCVILAQTQDELSGTRQEVSVAQTAALKTFTATRSSYLRARDRAEHRSRDLQDKVDELRGLTLGNPPDGNGGSQAEAAQVAEAKPASAGRSRLEIRLVALREEVQASELALDQATVALKDEKASLVTEVDIILKALGEREEDRLGKMKMALGELYHMQSQVHAATLEEEDKRGVLVDRICVSEDMRRFVTDAVGRANNKDESVQVPREALGEPRYSTLLQSRLQSLLQILREEEKEAAAAQPSSSTSTTPRQPAEPTDLQVRYSDLSNGLIGRTSLLPHSMSLDDTSMDLSASAAAASSAFVRRSLDGSVGSMDISFLSDEDEDEEEEDDDVVVAAPDARHRADATVGARSLELVLDATGTVALSSPRDLTSPSRAVIRSRTTSAQALATDRLPDSMSPRPNSHAPSSPRPFLMSPGRFAETTTDISGQGTAPPSVPVGATPPPRPASAARQAHAELLFPSNQTMSSSLFRGIELRQSSTDLDQMQQTQQQPEQQAATTLPLKHPTPVSTGDRSAFRPITPQPLSKRTSTGADSVADPAPVLAREGRSNSLSSSISSSISKSLSITLQRPATPQNARASTPQAEDGAAAAREPTPPPVDDGSSEEIKIFNLPPSERVIESYSCALLPNNLLIHGRLFVTQCFVCFGSWGTTRLVLPIEGVDFVEKANTMGFVPNALWVIMKAGERYFFSSFLYRDNCFDLIHRLLPKRLSTIELKTLPDKMLEKKLKQEGPEGDTNTAPSDGQQVAGEGDITLVQDGEATPDKSSVAAEAGGQVASAAGVMVAGRRVSFTEGDAAAPTTTSPTESGDRTATPPRVPAPSPAPPLSAASKSPPPPPPPVPLPPRPVVVQEDTVIRRMTVLTAETLETTIDTFVTELWGHDSSFYLDYLQERGDHDIQLGRWESKDEQDNYSGESFNMVREVRYNRNRAGETVGPRMALTKECQMYRIDHDGDRAVITTVLSFTGIPYCDYFSVQTRWILTRVVVGHENHCRLQVGLDVVFRQNLLLRAAIRSGTEGEMKRVLQNYLGKARARLRTARAAAAALLLQPDLVALQPQQQQPQQPAVAEVAMVSVVARSRGNSLLVGGVVVEAATLPSGLVGAVMNADAGTQPMAVAALTSPSPAAAMAAMEVNEPLVRRVSRAMSEPCKAPGGRGVEVVRQVLAWALKAATATLNTGLPLTDGLVVRDAVVLGMGLALFLLWCSLARANNQLSGMTRQLEALMREQERTVKQLAALQQQLQQQR